MITFKQFLAGYKKKFVCLEFDDSTNEKLYQFAMDNGFDLSIKYDGTKQNPKNYLFHTTIYYSSSYHDTKPQNISLDPFKVYLDKFELLGENNDVPVIKLKVEGEIKRIRDHFTNQGYKDNWPDYKPHISLSYEKKKYDLSGMALPDFPIVVNKLTIENQ